jgi:hypothetical protein
MGGNAMIEEPCIIQMNIDRYRAMLNLRPDDEQRARIEQLLAEANRQFASAARRLARAIDSDDQDSAVDQVRL